MKTIYKHILQVEDEQILKLPLGSKIVSTAFQGDDLCIWALVDKDVDDLIDYKVYVHGTGHDLINPYADFVGTVFIKFLVFHVFAEIKN